MRLNLTLFFWACLLLSLGKCSNILVIFNAPSKSHTILGVKLAEGLIKRGHQITFASPFHAESSENLTHIHLKSILDYKDENMKEHKGPTLGKFEIFQKMVSFFNVINQLIWEEPGIQRIIEEKPKYDAVILFSFFNEALMGIAHHLEIPVILFSPIGSSCIANKYVANPNMVYATNPILSFSTDNFLGRLTTVTANALMEVVVNLFIKPVQQATLKKYLPNAPPLDELKNKVSLILANSHYSIEPPRPYVPNMIQIGGFHVQDTKELPQDLKEYLDSAKQGAILFSMGSNVEIGILDKNKREAIIKVLGEMKPMKVIFKSEIDHKNLPTNVMVKKWLPQADILAHPNIKVFISHGGLGGNTEAIYHGVPILGIPFFGDQKMNLDKAQSAGYATILQYDDLTEELLRSKLKEILEDPSYTMNAKKRSALIKEQPVKPMDNAAFWIEHIIKYGGGAHLRNAGMDLAWYEFYMFDIYVFYTIFICLVIVIIVYIMKFSLYILKSILVRLRNTPKTKQS